MREIYCIQSLLNSARISSLATSLCPLQLSGCPLVLTLQVAISAAKYIKPSTLSLHPLHSTFSFLPTLVVTSGLGDVDSHHTWLIVGCVWRTLSLVGINRDKPNALLLSSLSYTVWKWGGVWLLLLVLMKWCLSASLVESMVGSSDPAVLWISNADLAAHCYSSFKPLPSNIQWCPCAPMTHTIYGNQS